jgi:hypothetical protein
LSGGAIKRKVAHLDVVDGGRGGQEPVSSRELKSVTLSSEGKVPITDIVICLFCGVKLDKLRVEACYLVPQGLDILLDSADLAHQPLASLNILERWRKE